MWLQSSDQQDASRLKFLLQPFYHDSCPELEHQPFEPFYLTAGLRTLNTRRPSNPQTTEYRNAHSHIWAFSHVY